MTHFPVCHETLTRCHTQTLVKTAFLLWARFHFVFRLVTLLINKILYRSFLLLVLDLFVHLIMIGTRGRITSFNAIIT